MVFAANNSIINTNSGNIEVSQNIILNNINQYPSPSSSYIQFSDGSQQVTAYKTIIGEIKMYAGLTLPPNYVWV